MKYFCQSCFNNPFFAVENSIRIKIQEAVAGASQTGSLWSRVTVAAATIEYRAFTLAGGIISGGNLLSKAVKTCALQELPKWHQKIFERMMQTDFPGQQEIHADLISSEYEMVDSNGTLKIHSQAFANAPIMKTIPVEALSYDDDGVPISVLLFARKTGAYMLQIMRLDGEAVRTLPSPEEFQIMVLPC